MQTFARKVEAAHVRRMFPAWSTTVPLAFDETFVDQDGYWYAYGEDRSVSLTSMLLEDESGVSPTAEMIAAQFPAMAGDLVTEMPAGLLGWAVETDAIEPARASRLLQGMLAVDGRALIVTVTSDDREWARRTWLSIRHHPDEAARESRAPRRIRRLLARRSR